MTMPEQSAPSRTPVVACQGLTKVFRDFWMRQRARAVDNITFHIDHKEIFGLLGPNGSGKSTTIKLLLGLLRPTAGRIAVFGKDPGDVATKRRIGYLPEESYLYGFLNARETLDYYGKLFELDRKARKTRTDELLDMVGLTHAQHRPVREYSKGMQRRIGIAQALINDPDLLILDEPTTGLDPIGTRQVKDLILELGRRGKSILLSSHLLADVEDVVDRMVILYGGKIRRAGQRDELLTRRETTSIEADELDDETIAEIDRVIRERSGGAKSMLRVSKPRQKLEDLFLGIVEEARREHVVTSGATHGGPTAAFLRAATPAGPSGEELIEALVREEAPAAPEPAGGEAGAARAPDRTDDLLAGLLKGDEPEAPAGPAQGSSEPAPSTEGVDLGVIGSLVDDDEKRERQG
jgi:ABC-2 type transport system ATP-binding protein